MEHPLPDTRPSVNKTEAWKNLMCGINVIGKKSDMCDQCDLWKGRDTWNGSRTELTCVKPSEAGSVAVYAGTLLDGGAKGLGVTGEGASWNITH